MSSSISKSPTAHDTGSLRVIQGLDGPVEIDQSKQTVIKTFLKPAPEIAVLKAKREVEYASRFLAAVSDTAGLSCPEILEFDFSPPPRVTMRLCPGETLWDVLRTVRRDDPRLDKIAGRIHDCLEIYVTVFAESRHDFRLKNMLYDDKDDVLTLIDFANDAAHGASRDFPLDVIVGQWVGRVCYDLARPSHLTVRKTAYLELARKVLTSFEGQVSKSRVHDFAYAAFLMWGPCGKTVRRRYYATVGAVIVKRLLKRLGLSSTIRPGNAVE